MRDVQPQQSVLDRRSLAYRLNMVLNTMQVVCVRGSDNSASTHRRSQAFMALTFAADLGSTMSVDELMALREGDQLKADPRELALIAQAMDVPEWVLTQTPPEGKRVVLTTTRAGGHLAVLVSDDGDPGGALTPAAKQELAAWLQELPQDQRDKAPNLPVSLTRHDPVEPPAAVQDLPGSATEEEPARRRRWSWR